MRRAHSLRAVQHAYPPLRPPLPLSLLPLLLLLPHPLPLR
jgi:hypothetical protein